MTDTSPTADQMLAAITEARWFAPHNRTLLDPDAGDGYTLRSARAASCGYEQLSDSVSAVVASGLERSVFVRPGEGAVLVRGDFAETYRDGYVGGEPDWPTPLDALGLATFVGEQECRRCSVPGLPPRVVHHVLRVAFGRTVVEMAYCDDCADVLSVQHDLVWEHGGPRAAV